MKFPTIAVLFALAAPSVSAFGVPSASQQVSFARVSSLAAKSDAPSEYASLEDRLLNPPPAPEKKPFKKAEPAPPKEKEQKVKPEPKPKKEKEVKGPKGAKYEPTLIVETETVPEVAPKVAAPKAAATKTKTGKVEYVDLEVDKPTRKPNAAAKSQTRPPAPPKAPVIKKERKARPAAAVSTSTPDANTIPTGIVLGGAPLILAPLVALAAARSTLSSTKGRRDQIEKEIAEFEALEAIRLAEKKADVDVGTLSKAVVSMHILCYVILYCALCIVSFRDVDWTGFDLI